MHGKFNALIEYNMIAATAYVHDLTVATINGADFKEKGARLEPIPRARP